MSLRLYLFLMTLGTLLAWIAWAFVVVDLSPLDGNLISLISFYLSLLMAITGSFSVIGFALKKLILKNDDIVFRHVKRTFRQGILTGLAVILVLFLLSQGLLFWWNSIILALFFLFVEIIIFTNYKHNNDSYV
ncbi:MAG: hypothetical protein AAB467_05030 [Patescibacteria group bacterium]